MTQQHIALGQRLRRYVAGQGELDSRLGIALGLAISVAACRSHAPDANAQAAAAHATPTTTPAATRAQPAKPVVLGKLATPDVFELVTTSSGAVLVWAEPGACAGSVRVQRLDASGQALGNAWHADANTCAAASELGASARIVELAAASGGGQLGLGWIAQDEHAAIALGTYAADDAQLFAPTQRLGAAHPKLEAPRGRLLVSASPSGQLRLALRAPAAACVSGPGICAQLVTQTFMTAGASDPNSRRGEVRELPAACPRTLIGSSWVMGTWFDAFCALGDDGVPTTHVYAIRPEISYAAAIPTLRECESLGLAPFGQGVIAWGACAGSGTHPADSAGLSAHSIGSDGRELVLDDASSELLCRDGRPTLRISGRVPVTGEGRQLEDRLELPRDRLESSLPATIASRGARAVFTGSSLIVASSVARDTGSELVVTHYRCRMDQLVSDAEPML